MRHMTVKIHEIAKDGYPDMDKLVGRVAFIFDGRVKSGWPLFKDGEWEENGGGVYTGITHWIEFPEELP